VTRLELAASTTPTQVPQRISPNILRKSQISCEITAFLAKWTSIVQKNYEPNRKTYAPDCTRFLQWLLALEVHERLARAENVARFICNGVVLV